MTQGLFETDVIPTPAGELRITFLGHASLVFSFAGKIVHVDPYGQVADYTRQPKADLVLVTHEHGDHLDTSALAVIRSGRTAVIINQASLPQVPDGIVMHNGDAREEAGFAIKAVPAYNLVHKRGDGKPFHPQGVGNGYVITFGGKKVYVAGDTENIPEMKDLRGIDIAFLPVNLPYTMTPEMAADAARMFNPAILYPYHFGSTDISRLTDLLKDEPIEVRVRELA
jgi:L-ascorbate metabolism protein UlaG (beta-lactamase superfamily)